MPEIVSFPFDPNATLESNFIKNEYHTVTAVNAAPYRILIPELAPFYVNNLKVEHIDALGVRKTLDEGVDYYLALPYVGATRSTGKAVYGGIPIITSLAAGTIALEYRIVGGPWTADRDYVYAALLETVYNPRVTWWEKLTNVQAVFPPTDHDQSLDDVEGTDAILGVLGGIREAILQAPQMAPARYLEHLLAQGNPHNMTPDDLNLGNASAKDVATDEQVFLKEDSSNLVTLGQVLRLIGYI